MKRKEKYMKKMKNIEKKLEQQHNFNLKPLPVLFVIVQ